MRTNVMATLATVCALSWSGVSLGSGSADDTMEGTVVKTDRQVLYLKMRGAVIPVHITAHTHFEGGRQKLKQFAAGEQVRVALRPDSQTLNEARSVGLSNNAQEGTGGSGFAPDAMPRGSVEPTQPSATPLQPGTGAGSPNEGVIDDKRGAPSIPAHSGTPSGMPGQPQGATGAAAPQP